MWMIPHQYNVVAHCHELSTLLFGQLLGPLAPQQLEFFLDDALRTQRLIPETLQLCGNESIKTT